MILNSFLLAAGGLLFGTAAAVVPTPEQVAWADCEVGVIIHCDMQVFEPGYEFRKTPGYVPDAKKFNPTALDTDQWLRTAQAAGAKYAVLVAKHCSGFSLWPTKAHSYSVASSPWRDGKGDVVADFIASCKKFGLKPGIYASTGCNAYLGVDNNAIRDAAKWDAYVKVVTTQLTELWTNYGELFEIWFDGGNLPADKGGREIEDLLVRLQPKAVVFQGNPKRMSTVRWIGNERAVAPEPCFARAFKGTASDGVDEQAGEDYSGSFDGAYWSPGEADMPNRDLHHACMGGWFWAPGEDALVVSADELMERYFTSVGRGCNLLLGMVIDDRGLVPEVDAKTFAEFGVRVAALHAKKVVAFSVNQNRTEFTVPTGARPSILSVKEDIRQGENAGTFLLSGFDGHHWHSLYRGGSIGHRRLCRFRPGDYERYRFDCWRTRDNRAPALTEVALIVE